jgi:hypothetical protein
MAVHWYVGVEDPAGKFMVTCKSFARPEPVIVRFDDAPAAITSPV